MCNKYIFQKTDIQNDDSETTTKLFELWRNISTFSSLLLI